MDFIGYQPNPAVIERLRSVDFAAVIGPTAAGKTTLLDAVIATNPTIHPVLVTMTRAPRPGEKDGTDNHYRTEQEVLKRIARREFVQVAPRVLGDIYATAQEDYATDGIAVMPVIADAITTFDALPFRRIRKVVILPPNIETWQQRVGSRNFTPEQKAKRMEEARRSLRYAIDATGVEFIVNRSLKEAVRELEAFLLYNISAMPAQKGRRKAHELLRAISM